MRALAIAAAVLFASSTLASAETLRVAVPQKGSWENSAPELGSRAGFFKDEGLELDILYTNGGAESQQALLAGSVDVATGAGLLGVMGAISKGAPLVIIASAFTGPSDSFWYVKDSSPLKSMKDATGKTIAYTTTGSSSHVALLNLLDFYGVKAQPIGAGGFPAIMTQVMSGQIDVGFSVAPLMIKQVDDKEIRIIARGAEVPALQGQTIRVNMVTTQGMEKKRDALRRWARAMNRTLAWMYDDPRALEWYAEMIGLTVEQTRRARDQFQPPQSVQAGPPQKLELSLQQALQFKFVPASYTLNDLAKHIDIIDGK